MWMDNGKLRSKAEDKDLEGSCDFLSAIVTCCASFSSWTRLPMRTEAGLDLQEVEQWKQRLTSTRTCSGSARPVASRGS